MALRQGVKSVTVEFNDGEIVTFTGENMRYVRTNNHDDYSFWIEHMLQWKVSRPDIKQGKDIPLDTEPHSGV